jgi:hypothetical protein
MNWLHFFLWIAGIYGLYYAVVILLDTAKASRSPSLKTAGNELTFSEPIQPQKLEHIPEPETQNKTKAGVTDTGIKIQREPEVMATGGVGIRDLFNLARQEAIIYTRPVSFYP